MNCTAANELFSSYLEEDLAPQERERLVQHFEECASCHANYESFRYALGDLQSLSVRETSHEEIGAILAAVEHANQPRRGRTRTVLTHLVAAGIGAVLVWLLWPEDVRIEERFVETRVEVPVEVPVELVVEVPVEVVVEKLVQVEVPVEVERVVEVPVPVERIVAVTNPVQVHVNRLLAFGDALVRLADLAEETADLRAPEMLLAEARKPVGAIPATRVAARARSGSPVRVLRTGNQITLKTRGSLAEIVPVLIAMLSEDDPRTRRVVEERLQQIRGQLGGELPGSAEPEPAPRPTALARLKSLVNLSSETEESTIEYSPSESWRAWWSSRSGKLAVLDTRSTY